MNTHRVLFFTLFFHTFFHLQKKRIFTSCPVIFWCSILKRHTMIEKVLFFFTFTRFENLLYVSYLEKGKNLKGHPGTLVHDHV